MMHDPRVTDGLARLAKLVPLAHADAVRFIVGSDDTMDETDAERMLTFCADGIMGVDFGRGTYAIMKLGTDTTPLYRFTQSKQEDGNGAECQALQLH